MKPTQSSSDLREVDSFNRGVKSKGRRGSVGDRDFATQKKIGFETVERDDGTRTCFSLLSSVSSSVVFTFAATPRPDHRQVCFEENAWRPNQR